MRWGSHTHAKEERESNPPPPHTHANKQQQQSEKSLGRLWLGSLGIFTLCTDVRRRMGGRKERERERGRKKDVSVFTSSKQKKLVTCNEDRDRRFQRYISRGCMVLRGLSCTKERTA